MTVLSVPTPAEHPMPAQVCGETLADLGFGSGADPHGWMRRGR